ncbi:hypothetical protein [Cupriavidus basilensis]|nr:hypothetical protein [Cupriavidus basilensis]MDR3382424.1 hypothetical protein [Cupriavidus basilensis]
MADALVTAAQLRAIMPLAGARADQCASLHGLRQTFVKERP